MGAGDANVNGAAGEGDDGADCVNVLIVRRAALKAADEAGGRCDGASDAGGARSFRASVAGLLRVTAPMSSELEDTRSTSTSSSSRRRRSQRDWSNVMRLRAGGPPAGVRCSCSWSPSLSEAEDPASSCRSNSISKELLRWLSLLSTCRGSSLLLTSLLRSMLTFAFLPAGGTDEEGTCCPAMATSGMSARQSKMLNNRRE